MAPAEAEAKRLIPFTFISLILTTFLFLCLIRHKPGALGEYFTKEKKKRLLIAMMVWITLFLVGVQPFATFCSALSPPYTPRAHQLYP
jgi:hypothetical protein